MARVLGHRQTKEAATDNPNLMSPRHIPTLQTHPIGAIGRFWPREPALASGPPAVCGQGTEAANDRPFGDIERAPLESFGTAGTDIQALFRSLHSADDLSG
jgi:hypothetical protein